MATTTKICAAIGFCLLASTLLFHLLAMIYPRWKIYEHRRWANETMYIGLFDRCESRFCNNSISSNQTERFCSANKYSFDCKKLIKPDNDPAADKRSQVWCNNLEHAKNCNYSPIAKGLIVCTIIAACTFGIALFLIFLHLIMNPFKYKSHMFLSILSLFLLIIGFLSILATLILLGVTLNYDLYQYRYNLDCLLSEGNGTAHEIQQNVTDSTSRDYESRLDLSGVFEIIALFFSSFTITTEVIYLISLLRNRIG